MQFSIFKFKAFLGSKLRATGNKPILRIILKRSLIPIRSSNLTYLVPFGQLLMGAKLIIGTPLIRKKKFLKINPFGLCKNAWLLCQLVM